MNSPALEGNENGMKWRGLGPQAESLQMAVKVLCCRDRVLWLG